MLKKIVTFNTFVAFVLVSLAAANATNGKVHVDSTGVMRDSATGEEVSYYGVNYTVPFAHAYRALGYLGVDRKEAIEKDVYHMARLGFNAFRIHVWDVEISDAEGNLIANEHLDLLDFLIARCEERGIDIVLTAQTNFGNGYPERNIDTGAFTYHYEKCRIHDTEEAIQKQERYIHQFVTHRNPYTGKRYADDPAIIALEINNEPCHSGDENAATAYINRMVHSAKEGGWGKPVFYNVSHNLDVVQGFLDADIQGGTYQWYPVGLVSGYTREGNFLPLVDNYEIPFKNNPNFNTLAKLVYEYDPADNLHAYLHPAMIRTLRKEGFQWITQFSYDPIDMARFNTEYQTHFLNLAYTPRKALSMMIAAEVARTIPRGADYGVYPRDTIFDVFRVSYHQDLSEMNSREKFLYSNNTQTRPIAPGELVQVAGYGSSPVIGYSGTGAYFLDRVDHDTWRLEVMPDVVLTTDPFKKPSLTREVAAIIYKEHPMDINLPSLGNSFYYKGISTGNDRHGKAENGRATIYPGVYLLSKEPSPGTSADSTFVAPKETKSFFSVMHHPVSKIAREDSLTVQARIYGHIVPDSLVIYPREISFWREDNRLYKMQQVGDNLFEATIRPGKHQQEISYTIVAFTPDGPRTFPQDAPGTPLTWDFNTTLYYTVTVTEPNEPVVLLEPTREFNKTEVATIPDAQYARLSFEHRAPVRSNVYRLEYTPSEGWPAGDNPIAVIKRYVREELRSHPFLGEKQNVVISLDKYQGVKEIEIAILSTDGITYSAKEVPATRVEVPLSRLKQSPTLICPAPYPSFLPRTFESPEKIPLQVSELEFIQVTVSGEINTPLLLEIQGIWLE